MKIAILTQPICNNYGGILQNYALQHILEQQGHEVVTLNFPVLGGYSGTILRHSLSICKRTLHKLLGYPDIVWIDIAKESKKQVELARQKSFIDKYLHLIDIIPPITYEAFNEIIHSNKDSLALIVGSDQVWRPRYNKYIENMFFDFAKDLEIKRIAYAASFGTDQWEINHEQTRTCSTLAEKIDAISVREASGVGLCKKHLGVDAIQVLDPTLMLRADDYLSLCSGNEHPKGDYIGVYTLDYSKRKMKLLQEISKRLNTPLYYIGRFTKKGYPTMESWLEGIAHAKYMITDSFHGTVFSTIFQRQFITLGNTIRGNSRFQSLFQTLNISTERQTNDVERIITLLQEPINYAPINASKFEWKQKSLEFLTKSLSNSEEPNIE